MLNCYKLINLYNSADLLELRSFKLKQLLNFRFLKNSLPGWKTFWTAAGSLLRGKVEQGQNDGFGWNCLMELISLVRLLASLVELSVRSIS